jgi:hypothetical protein
VLPAEEQTKKGKTCRDGPDTFSVNIRLTGRYRVLRFPQILCDLSGIFRISGTAARHAALNAAYYS